MSEARWQDLRGVFQADFNHDGSRVITRLRAGEIGLWDVAAGSRVEGDLAPALTSTCYEMSGDHRFVIVGFEKGARVFDCASAAAISPLLDVPLRDELVVPAVFAPDGNVIVIFEETQASVWNAKRGERVAAIPMAAGPYEEAPPSAIFTADSTRCFLMDPNGTVTRYDTRTWKADGKPMRHPRFDTAYEFDFSASPDGKWLATFDDAGENGPKGQLQVWDVTTGRPLGAPLVNVNGFSARFLADPPRVLVEPARGPASVRALPSLKPLYPIAAHDEIDGPALAVSPNGKWLLAWGSDCTIALLDAATGKPQHHYSQKATIGRVLVAPDSMACYVRYDNSTFLNEGFQDNYVMRLSLPDLNVTASFRSLDFLRGATLSPDGRRLLLLEGGDDQERLRLFNATDLSALSD